MDESRKLFEEWRISDSPNSNLFRDTYGQYAEIGTWVAWKAWQASRATIEIKLPSHYEYDDEDMAAASHAIGDCADVIRAAGIKVKE